LKITKFRGDDMGKRRLIPDPGYLTGVTETRANTKAYFSTCPKTSLYGHVRYNWQLVTASLY